MIISSEYKSFLTHKEGTIICIFAFHGLRGKKVKRCYFNRESTVSQYTKRVETSSYNQY